MRKETGRKQNALWQQATFYLKGSSVKPKFLISKSSSSFLESSQAPASCLQVKFSSPWVSRWFTSLCPINYQNLSNSGKWVYTILWVLYAKLNIHRQRVPEHHHQNFKLSKKFLCDRSSKNRQALPFIHEDTWSLTVDYGLSCFSYSTVDLIRYLGSNWVLLWLMASQN